MNDRFRYVNILLMVSFFQNFFIPSALAAKADLGLKFDLSRVASEIFYSNRSEQEFTGDQSKAIQYTDQEIAQKLVDMIESESLRGTIADQYLSFLVEDSALIAFQRERLIQMIPTLELTPKRMNYFYAKLNPTSTSLSSELKMDSKPAASNTEASVPDFFELIKIAIEKLPDSLGIRDEMKAALDVVKQVVVCDSRVVSCTDLPSGGVSGSNSGIMRHMSTELELDHALMFESLRFALRMYQYTQQHPAWVDHGIFQTTNLNVWSVAMEITQQNADRSMRVIGTFGHDICCNSLSSFSKKTYTAIGILNHFRPNAMSSDGHVSDEMYVPGSMPEMVIPPALLRKFTDLSSDYKKLYASERYYRSGYYHVFGGMLTGQAILKAGHGAKNGWKISTTLSEALGYAYKRYVMEGYMGSDAKLLWKSVGSTTLGVKLLSPLGFAKWGKHRFAKAKNELETHVAFLELTQLQHKLGADFAFKHYQD